MLAPPIEEARRQAEVLVGARPFSQTLADPSILKALQNAGRMYVTLEAGEIPKLLLPQDVLTGGFRSSTQLDDVLEKQLDLKPDRR